MAGIENDNNFWERESFFNDIVKGNKKVNALDRTMSLMPHAVPPKFTEAVQVAWPNL